MTTKQKIGAVAPSRVVVRTRAIEAALDAMDPTLEVFTGILRLIAEFAEPHGEHHARGKPRVESNLEGGGPISCSVLRRRGQRSLSHLQ